MRLHVGIDDTDSLAGGCTTRIATDLVLALCRIGVTFLDYPNLIRLNPNVPWKTRGNGAVCLRLESDLQPEEIVELAVEEIERNSRLSDPETDPGVVVLRDPVPPEVVEFSNEALTRIVTPSDAVSVIKRVRAEAIGYGTTRGIIGALAAIGNLLDREYTYELIAYRAAGSIGKPRLVDKEQVLKMDEEMKVVTFNNVDPETRRVLITPRGPDPILCGIRGESPEAVRKAFRMLSIGEPVDAWMIFRTNQGTDAHLVRNFFISELQDNCPVVVEATVAEKPHTIPGGHVIFRLRDETGSVSCAAYEPTGKFRDVVKRLEPEDRVRASGGMRTACKEIPPTLNLEKLEILELAACERTRNPICSVCGKRMKSAGRTQGFRCERCGTHDVAKTRTTVKRDLQVGTYLPPPRAHRHLTKPRVRYGREHSGINCPPALDWHFP